VHQESTRSSINIGPWVADFASCLKNVRDNFVACLNQINEIIVLNVFICKFKLTNETRVSFSQDGMAISWNNLSACECFFNVVSNVIFCPFLSKFCLEIKEELKAFLISKTVKGSSKAVHACRE
jgi:hypothetical protein